MTATKRRPDPACVLGVDMGGTKILAGVVDRDLQVLATYKVKTRADEGPDRSLEQLQAAIRQALEGEHGGQIAAIGLGIPGTVDFQRGLVTICPNLGWTDMPVGEIVRKAFGRPVVVDNDVNVGTLGECTCGAGQGLQDVIGIFIGTGIGGGVVLGGQLYRGMNGTAGEIGHMVVTNKGRLPGVKGQGYLEAVASRTAIVEYILRQRARGVRTCIRESRASAIKSSVLRKAVEQGDKLARRALRRSAKYVGDVASSIVHLLCPQMIILGGGVMDIMPEEYLKIVRRVVEKRALGHSAQGVQIVAGRLGDHAGIIGAAVLAWKALESGPPAAG